MLGLQQYTKQDRRRNDRITMLLHLLHPSFLFQLATGKGMRYNLTTAAGPLPSMWLRRVLLSIVITQQRSHKWKTALSVLDRGPGPQFGGRWGRAPEYGRKGGSLRFSSNMTPDRHGCSAPCSVWLREDPAKWTVPVLVIPVAHR
jgi:hypothetical protein